MRLLDIRSNGVTARVCTLVRIGTLFCLMQGVVVHAWNQADDFADMHREAGSLSIKASAGFESNIFEVNDRREPATGAWFQETTIEDTIPLGSGSSWSVTLEGAWKSFYGYSEADEYLAKPGLAWRVIDDDATTLTLNAHGARYRERIHSPFTRLTEHSEPGWSAGAGWDLERKLADKEQFTWEGGVDAQWFDSAPQDNFQFTSKAAFERQVGEALAWSVGTKWDFQRYRVRPPDVEVPGNPSDLSTLEGRLLAGCKWKLGAGWQFELEASRGGNFDLTNGYYNAGVVGVQALLRWDSGPWKLKLSAETEWVWSGKRDANINVPGHRLNAREYVFEAGVEFIVSEHFSVFLDGSAHLQRVNADESRDDATLNSFTDRTTRIGVACTF